MDNENIKKLMYSLKNLRYTRESSVLGTVSSEVIEKNNIDRVEQVIRQFLLDNHDGKLGQLEAKVFMYEQIISKSNFAPMIDEIKTELSYDGN